MRLKLLDRQFFTALQKKTLLYSFLLIIVICFFSLTSIYNSWYFCVRWLFNFFLYYYLIKINIICFLVIRLKHLFLESYKNDI